jgi:hypothetical protein
VGEVLYEAARVGRGPELQYSATTRGCLAPESFASICGFWQPHMVPTVISLHIHIENMKVIVTRAYSDPKDRIALPNPLERYFGGPGGQEFDPLPYADYGARYLVQSHSNPSDAAHDTCQPPHFAAPRRKHVLCMIDSVPLRDLKNSCARMGRFADAEPEKVRKVVTGSPWGRTGWGCEGKTQDMPL